MKQILQLAFLRSLRGAWKVLRHAMRSQWEALLPCHPGPSVNFLSPSTLMCYRAVGLRNYWFSSWIHIRSDSQGLCCGFAFPLGVCRRRQPGNSAPEVPVGLGPVCAALWPLFLKKFWPWCQERCPSSCGDYFPPVKAYSLQDFIIKHFICLSLLHLFRTHFLCSWE